MARMNGRWIPLLVGCLVAALIGPGVVAGAEQRVAVEQSIMVPAAAGIPWNSSMAYGYQGGTTHPLIGAGGGAFIIPLGFPVPVVSIKSISLYAYDDSDNGDVGLWLIRVYPPDGTQEILTHLSTSGHSSAVPQTVRATAVSPRQVNTARYGLYLVVELASGTSFYGAKIVYSYSPGA